MGERGRFALAGVLLGIGIAALAQAQDGMSLPLPVHRPFSVESGLPVRPTGPATSPIDLRIIAEFGGAETTEAAIGDTDHDGRNEIIVNGLGQPCRFEIYEEQGNDLYSLEYTGPCLYPAAIGDLDRDGKSELIGENGGFVRVYESVDANSYPTQLVWSSEYLSNVIGQPTVGDTDHDGRMEILHSVNTFGNTSLFVIFENRGDNSFSLVYLDTLTDQGANGNKVIGDLDSDGRTEIAFSGITGHLYVYEAIGNDSWERTCSIRTDMHNAYATSLGEDTDANGRDELFVMGDYNYEWVTKIYEATGDNTLSEVSSVSVYDGATGNPSNATVDLEMSGIQDYIMDTYAGLWVYRSGMPGRWNLIGQVPEPALGYHHGGVYPFDVNHNGRPEEVWLGYPTVLVLEYRSGVSAIEEGVAPLAPRLTISPNPSNLEAGLHLETMLDRAARLSVYDAAGRIVERRQLIGDGHGQILWSTKDLAAGVYILRLEDSGGRSLAVGHGVVLH